LRRAHPWGADVLVPPHRKVADSLVDTDPDDRHVLAAAASASARVVVTSDVDDFGRADLARLGVSAVNPDLFLARTMTASMYRFTLERLAARRTLAPNTPATIHASLGRSHPRLAGAMRATFPGVEPSPATDTPPAEVFRGNRCLACGRVLSDPESLASGIGPECGRTTTTRTST